MALNWYKATAKAKLRNRLEVVEGQTVNYRFEDDKIYIRFTYQNTIIQKSELNEYIIQELLACRPDVSIVLEEEFQKEIKTKAKVVLEVKKTEEIKVAYENLSEDEKLKADKINQGKAIIEPIKTKSKQIQILALYDAHYSKEEIQKVIKVDFSYLNEIILKYGNVKR